MWEHRPVLAPDPNSKQQPTDQIVLRYHELALKGRNRPFFVRRLVHQIQQLRKEAGLQIAERINVYYEGDAYVVEALQRHRTYVLREVLGQDARPGLPAGADAVHRKAIRLDGRVLTVGIAQVA